MRLFPTTLALTVLSSVVVLPGFAQEMPTSVLTAQATSTPQIDSFTVEPVEQLSPGTELVFTLQGTPNSQATLTIGTIRNLPMQQVEPGVYEGRYTLRSQDKFTDRTNVRANLRQGDRITSARLQEPLVTGSTGTQSGGTAQTVNIDRFTAQPVQQLDPGTELNFTLTGTANAKATFSIEGVSLNQPMQEVSPGTYTGRYVVRRQDYFPASGANVTASLQSGQQIVRARLDQNLAATSGATGTSQIPLEIISPANNSQVSGTVEVKGRSAPNTAVDVNVKATTSLAGLIGFDRSIFSRSVQTDANGNFSFSFKPSVAVPGTKYQVSLNAAKGSQTNQQTLVLVQQ